MQREQALRSERSLQALVACFLRFFRRVGEWLSLVEHLVRDQGVAGSNPVSPTILFNVIQPVFRTVPEVKGKSACFENGTTTLKRG